MGLIEWTDEDAAPRCGIRGCPEAMMNGAYLEVVVPMVGVARIGVCLGHFDALNDSVVAV